MNQGPVCGADSAPSARGEGGGVVECLFDELVPPHVVVAATDSVDGDHRVDAVGRV